MERNYFFYIAVVLTIAITVGSFISFDREQIITTRFSDKSIHIFGYFLLALSWLFAMKHKTSRLKFDILVSILVFTYGMLIEVLQGILTDNRQLDIYDILANFVGISVAYVFFNMVFQKKPMN